MRLVWDVVTLRERVRVTEVDRVRVTEVVRDTLTVAEREPILDGARVAATLRERVMVTLLLRVSEGVGDLVPNFDAGTVMRGLGDVVTLRVRVAACDAGTVKTPLRERVMVTLLLRVSEGVPDVLRLTVTERVSEPLTDLVASWDPRAVKAELGERE